MRSNYLGASDIPAIMGMSPYATALDVWRAKTAPQALPERECSREMLWGIALEPYILDRVMGQAEDAEHADQRQFASGDVRATCDRVLLDSGGEVFAIIEAKASSAPYVTDAWVIQCQVQAALSGLPVRLVVLRLPRAVQAIDPAPVGPDELRAIVAACPIDTFTIEPSETGRDLVREAQAWWDRHVIEGIAPHDVRAASLERFAHDLSPKAKPQPADARQDAILARLSEIKSHESQLGAEAEALRAELAQSMVSVQRIQSPYGSAYWTRGRLDKNAPTTHNDEDAPELARHGTLTVKLSPGACYVDRLEPS